jgi:hypothetical protein
LDSALISPIEKRDSSQIQTAILRDINGDEYPDRILTRNFPPLTNFNVQLNTGKSGSSAVFGGWSQWDGSTLPLRTGFGYNRCTWGTLSAPGYDDAAWRTIFSSDMHSDDPVISAALQEYGFPLEVRGHTGGHQFRGAKE